MKAKQSGFTLIELMVTIVILAVLLGIGAPSFAEFIRNSRITSKSNELLAAMHLARGEAIKRRVPVTVCSSDDAQKASPGCDGANFDEWIVFVDDDGDGTYETASGETLLRRSGDVTQGMSAHSNEDAEGYVQFGLDGFQRRHLGAAPVDLDIRICHDSKGNQIASGTDESTARAVVIARTGRPEVTRSYSRIANLGGCGS